MPEVTSGGGVRIHYEITGHGSSLVLIHGYTSSAFVQWRLTGWVAALAPRHRLLLVDLRGHGRSAKPHESSAYNTALMAADVLAAMDAAGFTEADIAGYSMGTMVAMELLLEHPARFQRALLGGMGAVFPLDKAENCRDLEHGPVPRLPFQPRALLRMGLAYARAYDRAAARACWSGMFAGKQPVDAARLPEIRQPVLSVVGTRDRFCPGTGLLAERIPDCRRLLLPGRGHVFAPRDRRFIAAAAAFFAGR